MLSLPGKEERRSFKPSQPHDLVPFAFVAILPTRFIFHRFLLILILSSFQGNIFRFTIFVFSARPPGKMFSP